MSPQSARTPQAPPETPAGDVEASGSRRRQRLGSLPARITFFVFTVTCITSLAVTAISVRSTYRVLRQNIDSRFPSVLSSAAERVDLWYEQRVLELGVFAGNEILTESAAALSDVRSEAERARYLNEVRQYLRYLLESFPQYRALFLDDPRGRELLWVGEPVALRPELRAPPTATGSVGLSEIRLERGQRIQVASARVEGGSRAIGGEPHARLSALLDVRQLDEILASQDLGEHARAMLVDPSGRSIAGSQDVIQSKPFSQALPSTPGVVKPIDYESADGRRMVGSAARLKRFGWGLIVEEPFEDAFAPAVDALARILVLDLLIVLAFSLGARRIAISIVQPIDALAEAARRISEGDRNVRMPEPRTHDEVALLAHAFNAMTGALEGKAHELEESRHEVEQANLRLKEQYAKLQSVNQVLEQLSVTDGLTQLHNHRYFQDHLAREARRADRSQEPLSLILADIDHFKSWNDRLGHAAGDRILRDVACLMSSLIRDSDLLARYGGEEFALVAPDTDLDGAVQLAEKMRAEVAAHTFVIDTPGETRSVTMSFGVAQYRGDRQHLFDEADRALYTAKAAGRDCVMTAESDQLGRDRAD